MDRTERRSLLYTPDFQADLRRKDAGWGATGFGKPDAPVVALPYPVFILYMPGFTLPDGGVFHAEVTVVVEKLNALSPDQLHVYPCLDSLAVATIAGQEEGDVKTAYGLYAMDPKKGRFLTGAMEQSCMVQLYGRLRQECPDALVDGPFPSFESLNWIPILRAKRAMRIHPFLLELSYPGNHTVASRPAAKGKSVEWVKSRTHFLVMDRRSMAHISGNGGPITLEEHAAQIKRSAHQRIAHYRILRHPRWASSVGKRIRVKSSWVGPREWEGTDGKVYVVLDKKAA